MNKINLIVLSWGYASQRELVEDCPDPSNNQQSIEHWTLICNVCHDWDSIIYQHSHCGTGLKALSVPQEFPWCLVYVWRSPNGTQYILTGIGQHNKYPLKSTACCTNATTMQLGWEFPYRGHMSRRIVSHNRYYFVHALLLLSCLQ